MLAATIVFAEPHDPSPLQHQHETGRPPQHEKHFPAA
jgi:hypothetical protein